jgi:hypothetical protein
VEAEKDGCCDTDRKLSTAAPDSQDVTLCIKQKRTSLLVYSELFTWKGSGRYRTGPADDHPDVTQLLYSSLGEPFTLHHGPKYTIYDRSIDYRNSSYGSRLRPCDFGAESTVARFMQRAVPRASKA